MDEHIREYIQLIKNSNWSDYNDSFVKIRNKSKNNIDFNRLIEKSLDATYSLLKGESIDKIKEEHLEFIINHNWIKQEKESTYITLKGLEKIMPYVELIEKELPKTAMIYLK